MSEAHEWGSDFHGNPAVDAYEDAIRIRPAVLAQFVLLRIRQYMWTFYIGQYHNI